MKKKPGRKKGRPRAYGKAGRCVGLGVSLPLSVYDKLKSKAAKTGQSVSSVIAEILMDKV